MDIEEKIKLLTEENDKLKEKNAKLKKEYIKKCAELEKITALYNAIYSSRVWRVTKPARKFKDTLRKKRFIFYPLKALKILFTQGPAETFKRINKKIHTQKVADTFKIKKNRRTEEEKATFKNNVKFSVIVPLYNTPVKFLVEMIKSVQNQTYKNWELCLSDGSDDKHPEVQKTVKKLQRKDSRIKYKRLTENLGISGNTNAALEMATGDYIALFDHDDLLHPSALYKNAVVINEKDADFVYSDEATFTGNNPSNIVTAHFKSDFAPDTLRSYNYICHLTVFAKKIMDKVGMFRKECDGSQDYDMILRLTEQAEHIEHIPEILYYWRGHKNSTAEDISSKPYIINAAHKAITDHLERTGLKGTVMDAKFTSAYRIAYDIIGEPKISILIPNKDNIDSLEKCLSSVYEKSTYKNFEVIIIENNSTNPLTFDYYDNLDSQYENIKIAKWEGKFNYSAINNFGAKYATGDYILLLNNDVEIITPTWLEEMLMLCQRKEVGAVGAMLYYPDNTIQHAGVILGIGGVAGHAHKCFPRGDLGYMGRAAIVQNFSAVTFACTLIKKSVFDKLNGIDETFEVAFNDVDMCMRIRKAGYLICFTPYAELYHFESKSRGLEDTPEKAKRFEGEVLRFKKRWKKELEAGDPYYNPNLTLSYEDFSIKHEKNK